MEEIKGKTRSLLKFALLPNEFNPYEKVLEILEDVMETNSSTFSRIFNYTDLYAGDAEADKFFSNKSISGNIDRDVLNEYFSKFEQYIGCIYHLMCTGMINEDPNLMHYQLTYKLETGQSVKEYILDRVRDKYGDDAVAPLLSTVKDLGSLRNKIIHSYYMYDSLRDVHIIEFLVMFHGLIQGAYLKTFLGDTKMKPLIYHFGGK